MGRYLNSRVPLDRYARISRSPYFMDKTEMLETLSESIESMAGGISLTRPSRFGKTITASMIAAYFSPLGRDSGLFENLKIGKSSTYGDYCGSYDVIFIPFREFPTDSCYCSYISQVCDLLLQDLMEAYPEAEISLEDSPWDALLSVCQLRGYKQFIFVLDDWDYILRRDIIPEADRERYMDFLTCLLKDQNYVALAFATGILPSGRGDLFCDFTLDSQTLYNNSCGFTDGEVDQLYETYREMEEEPEITRQGLTAWYRGYGSRSGETIYNPWTVISALRNNNLRGYWTDEGHPREIDSKLCAMKDDVGKLVSGIPVPAQVERYTASFRELSTRNQILSALEVYGFLTCEDGMVRIPNKELAEWWRQIT